MKIVNGEDQKHHSLSNSKAVRVHSSFFDRQPNWKALESADSRQFNLAGQGERTKGSERFDFRKSRFAEQTGQMRAGPINLTTNYNRRIWRNKTKSIDFFAFSERESGNRCDVMRTTIEAARSVKLKECYETRQKKFSKNKKLRILKCNGSCLGNKRNGATAKVVRMTMNFDLERFSEPKRSSKFIKKKSR